MIIVNQETEYNKDYYTYLKHTNTDKTSNKYYICMLEKIGEEEYKVTFRYGHIDIKTGKHTKEKNDIFKFSDFSLAKEKYNKKVLSKLTHYKEVKESEL